ncbi:MAG: lipopolysaccharide heptosyltransferase I [Dechloromonas sp.]|jgi:heptosyltransferase-1|uniref:Lipopolysaccharide heptosyltransferase 1 n=1 Tax=Candidatus Dechloromonas phosphorivorans TaxID=2899244 RepID=A0A935KB96_9RHOO|nr:lipopolysaccharide heptosyltransferase I [Candidatus Dechloromonas phosphorivorans]
MRILIVKTSSLGDVIHNLPVVSDIHQHFLDAIIDWCVEESFAAIPRLHPGVNEVIPVALRRWKKNLLCRQTWQEVKVFRQSIARQHYDLVLDTQGLLKSALITRQARGVKCGYDANSAREPIAARFYDRCYAVSKTVHAVTRNRLLAAAALSYVADPEMNFGISAPSTVTNWLPATRYVVLLTATSRNDKLWPESHWQELAKHLKAQGFNAVFPGGSKPERERAARLAAALPGAIAAPTLSLPELAGLLARASAVVGVDTGLSHLAVALNVPTVAIYTATDPALTGVFGSGFHRNLGGKAQIPSVHSVLEALKPVLGA